MRVRRTPDATALLRLYARLRLHRLQRMDGVATQRKLLLRLVARARSTDFGRAHRFDLVDDVDTFQSSVPLRRYEDFWRDWWEPAFPRLKGVSWPEKIPFFAVSSGTTSGTSKYLPLTKAMIRANNKAGFDLLSFHLHHKPDSRVFGGKSFMLGGSTRLKEEAPGIRSGDLSGIMAAMQSPVLRPLIFPPRRLAAMADWEAKVDAIARAALDVDVRAIAGTPSWLLLQLERIRTLRGPDGPLFPNLSILVHGGIAFGPYRRRFEEVLNDPDVDFREVYPASEGFLAVADRGPEQGMRLNLDHGVFYEFVPVEELDAERPTRHWIANVQPDVNYAVVLSTAAGLWSYVLGDTVRFVETRPPRVLVTGRTSYMMSAFGEHLIAEEVETAVAAAAAEQGADVTDYTLGAVFPVREGDLGHHRLLIEFRSPLADPAAFAAKFDSILIERNDDYRAHREGGFGLGPPQVVPVSAGAFNAWMAASGRLGGQNKVPRILTDRDRFAQLDAFLTGRAQEGGTQR